MSKLVFKSKEKEDIQRQIVMPDYIFEQVKKVFKYSDPKIFESINMILPNKKGDFQIFLPRSIHAKTMIEVLELIEEFFEEYEIFVV